MAALSAYHISLRSSISKVVINVHILTDTTSSELAESFLLSGFQIQVGWEDLLDRQIERSSCDGGQVTYQVITFLHIANLTHRLWFQEKPLSFRFDVLNTSCVVAATDRSLLIHSWAFTTCLNLKHRHSFCSFVDSFVHLFRLLSFTSIPNI